jgi:hypothetical protein
VARSRFTFLPEAVIPRSELFAGDFPVPCGRIEALVSQVLLKKTKPVAGVIVFHRIDSEGVPKFVWADAMGFAGFRIYQFRQPCSLGELFNDLPATVPVDVEKKPSPVFDDWTTTLDKFPEHIQSLFIDRQYTLSAMLEFLEPAFFYFAATFGTVAMRNAEFCSAVGARYLQAALKMNDRDYGLIVINILNFQSKSFTDPTAEMEKKMNKELISNIGSSLFYQDNLFGFKIRFHLLLIRPNFTLDPFCGCGTIMVEEENREPTASPPFLPVSPLHVFVQCWPSRTSAFFPEFAQHISV